MKILELKAHRLKIEPMAIRMTIDPEEIELKFNPTQVITITISERKEYPSFQTVVSLRPTNESYALEIDQPTFLQLFDEAAKFDETNPPQLPE